MKTSAKVLTCLALMAILGTMGSSALASAETTDGATAETDSLDISQTDGEQESCPMANLEGFGGMHWGDGYGGGERVRPEPTEEQKAAMDAMKEAIENGDYAAWYELASEAEGPIGDDLTEVITEENFTIFSELMKTRAHLKELEDELGLENNYGHGFGHGCDHGFRK